MYSSLVRAGTLNTNSVIGVFGSSISKSSVERVYFVDHEVVPAGATKWDASVEGNYAITGWAVDDNQNGIYEIYGGNLAFVQYLELFREVCRKGEC